MRMHAVAVSLSPVVGLTCTVMPMTFIRRATVTLRKMCVMCGDLQSTCHPSTHSATPLRACPPPKAPSRHVTVFLLSDHRRANGRSFSSQQWNPAHQIANREPRRRRNGLSLPRRQLLAWNGYQHQSFPTSMKHHSAIATASRVR
jgi:hypothetical protein